MAGGNYSESEFRELADRIIANGGSVPETGPVSLATVAGKRTHARARIAGNRYKSGLEKRWGAFGPALISDEFGSPVIETKYEPFSLNMSGGSYTPDFMHVLEDGRIVIVETKGNMRMKNARDSRTKFRAVANDFSIFYFVWVEMIPKSGGSVTFERYDPFGTSETKTIAAFGGNLSPVSRPKSRRKYGRQ